MSDEKLEEILDGPLYMVRLKEELLKISNLQK